MSTPAIRANRSLLNDRRGRAHRMLDAAGRTQRPVPTQPRFGTVLLTLSLLVLCLRANDHYNAVAPNQLALWTAFLNRRAYFHDILPKRGRDSKLYHILRT